MATETLSYSQLGDRLSWLRLPRQKVNERSDASLGGGLAFSAGTELKGLPNCCFGTAYSLMCIARSQKQSGQ